MSRGWFVFPDIPGPGPPLCSIHTDRHHSAFAVVLVLAVLGSRRNRGQRSRGVYARAPGLIAREKGRSGDRARPPRRRRPLSDPICAPGGRPPGPPGPASPAHPGHQVGAVQRLQERADLGQCPLLGPGSGAAWSGSLSGVRPRAAPPAVAAWDPWCHWAPTTSGNVTESTEGTDYQSPVLLPKGHLTSNCLPPFRG
jgi:hypothetical protein